MDYDDNGMLAATVIEIMGSQDDPWELDYGEERMFVDVIQAIVDFLAPQRGYEVTPTDPIVGRVSLVRILPRTVADIEPALLVSPVRL